MSYFSSFGNDLLSMTCKDVSIPEIGYQDSPLEWRGFKYPSISAPSIGELSLTLISEESLRVYQQFWEWIDEFSNNSITSETISNFEKNLDTRSEITVYQVNGVGENGAGTRYSGCYPIKLGPIQYGEEEGIVEFEVSFQVGGIDKILTV
jgi:hypothetical protein